MYIQYIYIHTIYIYILQMGTLQGYSVHNPCNISRDHSPTHCWLKCPFQGKATALSLHFVETPANINVRYSGNELVTSGTGIILFTGYQP